MSIIKKGVEKIGSYSIKKVYEKTLDNSSDVEQCIIHLAIPAYAHIGYISSLSFEIVGGSEMDPQNYTECAVRGSIIEQMPSGTPGNFTSDDWDAIMEDAAPIDPDQITAHGDSTDVDITGGEHVAANQHEFFRRTYTLGLPNNAYPTNANKIRYKAAGRYKGHARTGQMLGISNPKQLFVGALSSVPDVESDKSNSAAGGYSDMLTLYQALMDNLPVNSETTSPTQGEAMAAGIEDYLYHGFRHDTLAATDSLHIRMYLSARLDIYQPTGARYVPAP